MNLDNLCAREPIADRGISVVLPAYNNAATLPDEIACVSATLEKMNRGHEIIVVDDGSDDNTAEIVDRLAAGNRRVRRVSHESCQGVGAALRSGFRAAKYPLVLQWQHGTDPAEIASMLKAIDRVDFVCGYREHLSRTAGWRYWIYRMFLRIVFGVSVSDVDCGIRLYRRSALRKIPIQSNGRFANAEVIAKATFMNFLIDEVPVTVRADAATRVGNPHHSVLRDAVHVFRHPQFRTSNPTHDPVESAPQRA